MDEATLVVFFMASMTSLTGLAMALCSYEDRKESHEFHIGVAGFLAGAAVAVVVLTEFIFKW